jgi:PKD repeat protein
MQRIVDFFGSCAVDPITGLVATNDSPTYLGDATSLAATIETGTDVSYLWSFGDGEYGIGANQSHSYPALGLFTATVTATNSLGSERLPW